MLIAGKSPPPPPPPPPLLAAVAGVEAAAEFDCFLSFEMDILLPPLLSPPPVALLGVLALVVPGSCLIAGAFSLNTESSSLVSMTSSRWEEEGAWSCLTGGSWYFCSFWSSSKRPARRLQQKLTKGRASHTQLPISNRCCRRKKKLSKVHIVIHINFVRKFFVSEIFV